MLGVMSCRQKYYDCCGQCEYCRQCEYKSVASNVTVGNMTAVGNVSMSWQYDCSYIAIK